MNARIVMVLVTLGGCTVGPDFVAPSSNAPSHWWGSADAAHAVPDSGIRFGDAIDAAWWNNFHDPELTTLVTRLAAQNLDLQAAAERVQQGRAQRQIVQSEGLPHLDADASYKRTRESLTGPISLFEPVPGAPHDFDVWQDSLSASWELDLFGRVRRATEARRADTEVAIEARNGLALMTVSDLVQDYMQLRGVQAREKITQNQLANAERNVALVRNRFSNGVSTTLDIANAKSQQVTIAAMLPQVHADEARLINAIGVLLAQAPRSLGNELNVAAPQPPLPTIVPVGLPGALARRRPDLREAEARLHAATAETGVAVAAFYPDVQLMGNAGTQSLQFTEVFNLHSSFFSVGPTIDLPIFEGGRLRATLRLRRSEQREAALRYRATVLRAWQDADDALTAYGQARLQQERIGEAVSDNQAALAAARQRYAEGAVDFLNVIAAENAVLQSEGSLASLNTQLEIDLVGIYKALGGGWEVRSPPD